MKKFKLYITLLLIGIFIIPSCNDEWEDEQYKKAVSFVKCGVVKVYVKYNSEGGNVLFKVPVQVTGTTTNLSNINVTIDVDPDTIPSLNFDRFRLREDLYFKLLEPSFYEFESMTTTIPSGSDVGIFMLNLKLEGMDLIDKYILPIEILSASNSAVLGRKHFSKSLMQIIPFNDYSGRYSVSGMIYERNRPENQQVPLTVPYRNARVVDENTVFFFAGATEEESIEREIYKIEAKFNTADSTVTLTASDPRIKFAQQAGKFTVETKMDPVLPYLQRKYITANLEYIYDDISNPARPMQNRFRGPMVLEKVKKILVPEEDQQGEILEEDIDRLYPNPY